jgi:hypothetical protein
MFSMGVGARIRVMLLKVVVTGVSGRFRPQG